MHYVAARPAKPEPAQPAFRLAVPVLHSTAGMLLLAGERARGGRSPLPATRIVAHPSPKQFWRLGRPNRGWCAHRGFFRMVVENKIPGGLLNPPGVPN